VIGTLYLTKIIENEYFTFLDDKENMNENHKNVILMMEGHGQRLRININNLRENNPNRTRELLINYVEEEYWL